MLYNYMTPNACIRTPLNPITAYDYDPRSPHPGAELQGRVEDHIRGNRAPQVHTDSLPKGRF